MGNDQNFLEYILSPKLSRYTEFIISSVDAFHRPLDKQQGRTECAPSSTKKIRDGGQGTRVDFIGVQSNGFCDLRARVFLGWLD